MGKKKHKEKDNISTQTDAGSGQFTIFSTLFGDALSENGGLSIFSDNNPFRRKPQDPASGTVGLSSPLENPSNSSGNSDVGELMKRKRGKEKKHGTDTVPIQEAPETPSQDRKVKKKKFPNLNLDNGVSGEGNGGNPNLHNELHAVSKKDKGRTFESGSISNGGAPQLGGGNVSGLGLKLDVASKKGEGKNYNGRVLDGDDEGMVKGRKKRKRDELEREYEARKYGAVYEAEDIEKGLGGKIAGEKRKLVDNPADMLISKEGFDDESKLLRTVFVGNLPLKVKKKALLKEFSQFGEVESVRIRSVPIIDSKKPRKGAIMSKQINDSVDSVHAYIVFKTEQSADASLAHNMAVVSGNHIRVDRACPPRKKLKGNAAPIYDHKRTVFVGNLPFDVKDEELYQLFCGIKDLASSIEAVRVIRDPHLNVGKGFAYVLFKTREASNLVTRKRNLKLRDRELRLCHSNPNATPSKRRNESPAAKSDASPAKKRAITKSSSSYQGLRASKSGVQKKSHVKVSRTANSKSNLLRPEKQTVRMSKRPSVAARKAKLTAQNNGGATPKQAGMKRKLGSRTPESSHRSKKSRK